MKTRLQALPFVLSAVLAWAQPTTPPASTVKAAAPVATSAAPAELAALEKFLMLSDAELAQMTDAITRVRAMTPDQRTALRDEIASYRRLPEPQRQQIRQGWGWMPPEIQNGWREMMQTATPDERAAIQAKMQSLPPDEKTRYRRSLVESYLKAKAEKK
jgi:hypothetical protein